MARKKPSFWTEDKLLKLEREFNKRSPAQLATIFGKPYEVICSAYYFQQAAKKMQLSKRTVKRKTHSYKVTIYAAGFAEGTSRMAE